MDISILFRYIGDTVFPGKMWHRRTLFIVQGKIMSFGLPGVFRVLNDVREVNLVFPILELTFATPIFDFQVVFNFIFDINIY